MVKDKKELLKEIVNYNRKLINEADGDINKVIGQLITIEHNKYTIWNPFKDITQRFEVDPNEEYGKSKIEKFIRKYKNRIK